MIDYGQTVAGVTNFVPELRLDPVDPDVVATVTPFLELAEGFVTGRLAPGLRALDALDTAEATEAAAGFRAAAARLIEEGAASYTQDSRYPELAATGETDQAWGAVLWQRFVEALDALAGSVTAELERLNVDVITGAIADGPAVSAPSPTFTSTMRF